MDFFKFGSPPPILSSIDGMILTEEVLLTVLHFHGDSRGQG